LARHAAGATLEQARTVATATVVTAGLAIVIALEDEPGRRRYAVIGLCALMAFAFVLVYAIPAGHSFFDLASPTASMAASWAAGSAIAIALLIAALRVLRALDTNPRRSDSGAANA
jgi:cation-transporting ATPase E